ncbi:MAG: tetratricopeptide repeat protein [Planctomycetaceae bacterium]
MNRLTLRRRWVLVLAMLLSGCVTVADPPPTAMQTSPPSPSMLDRVLRRTRQPTPSPQSVAEIPREPKHPGKLSLAYAKLMEQSGNLGQAEEHYQRALDETPENVEALIGLGRVHLSAGRYDAAELVFNRALKEAPNNALALHGLGQVAAGRQRWKDAADLLNEAILADPANNAIRYDLAVALVQSGNVDSALPHFIRTVGDAEAHYNVGLILQRAGRLSESEEQLRLAIAKDPELEEARYWLEQVQQQQQLPIAPPVQTASLQLPR